MKTKVRIKNIIQIQEILRKGGMNTTDTPDHKNRKDRKKTKEKLKDFRIGDES